MHENYELVQRGFRILVGPLSKYVGNVMRSRYGGNWWSYVKEDVAFPEQKPDTGSFEELTASLDVADCFRLIDYNWRDAFKQNLDFNMISNLNNNQNINYNSRTPYLERSMKFSNNKSR